MRECVDMPFCQFLRGPQSRPGPEPHSWSSIELARYLLEEKSALDSQWLEHAQALLAYALADLGYAAPGNTTLVGEQDEDTKAWGGANSRLGSVAAILACLGGPKYYAQLGQNNVAWMTYFIDVDGCSSPNAYLFGEPAPRGGWQEDAHTDVLHSIVDAMRAFAGQC
eukprot:m.264764 g.264764  ORF g.264764 m.264764 type:complete len:167 (-) comp28568_c0_seq1:172-672(-)